METLDAFLESSSINGLNHIATTKKWLKLFWVLVVIQGFSLSTYLIVESFQSWSNNPISSRIETFPMREVLQKRASNYPNS